MPAHKHFQQTRQLNLWGFKRHKKNKNVWFHPHFIRGSVDGLKCIERVEVRTSDTSKRGPPPERRPTFDSRELKQVEALRIASPKEISTTDSSASSLATSRLKTGWETDNSNADHVSEVTIPNSGAMLIQALDKHKHFPFRLYDMLEYMSKSEHRSAIRWTHNGLAFVIIQQDVIVEHVLPIFFNQTKFRSFVSSSRILAKWP